MDIRSEERNWRHGRGRAGGEGILDAKVEGYVGYGGYSAWAIVAVDSQKWRGRRCSGTGVEGWSVLYSLSGWGELAVVRAYHRLKQRNTYDMPEYLRMSKVLMMHTNT